MHHVGNIGMTLKDPLQQWHLAKVEKFWYRRPHVGPVKSNGFCVVFSPTAAIVIVVQIITSRQLVKYSKGSLPFDLEHA